ncbi:MAG: TonB family protein [Betaproteobacteria bacterium]|nr:TonB family protein [Betaproteobacteria bacterium]
MRPMHAALALSVTMHAVIAAWLPALPQAKPDAAATVLQVELAPEPARAPPRQPASAPASVPTPRRHPPPRRRVSLPTVNAVSSLATPAVPPLIAATPRNANIETQTLAPQGASASSVPVSVEPAASAVSAPPKMRYQPPGFGAAYLDNPQPDYPPLARRMRLTGTVLLSVEVGVDGDPLAVTLQHSAGSDMLDQAALAAVRHWRFVPARQGDVPVSARVTVPIRFRLEN